MRRLGPKLSNKLINRTCLVVQLFSHVKASMMRIRTEPYFAKAEPFHNFCGHHSITKCLFWKYIIPIYLFYSGNAATGRCSLKVASQLSSRGRVHPEIQAQNRNKIRSRRESDPGAPAVRPV
jgi:hypothetical protein